MKSFVDKLIPITLFGIVLLSCYGFFTIEENWLARTVAILIVVFYAALIYSLMTD